MRHTMVRKVKSLSFRNLTLAIYAIFAVAFVLLTALFLNSLNRLEELQKIDRSLQKMKKDLAGIYLALKKEEKPSAPHATKIINLHDPNYDELPDLLGSVDKILAQPEIQEGIVRFPALYKQFNAFKDHYTNFRSEFVKVLPDIIETESLATRLARKLDSLENFIIQTIPDKKTIAGYLTGYYQWVTKGDLLGLRKVSEILSSAGFLSSAICRNAANESAVLLQKYQSLSGPEKHVRSLLGDCLTAADLLARHAGEMVNRQMYRLYFAGPASAFVLFFLVFLVFAFYSQTVRSFISRLNRYLSDLNEGRIPETMPAEGLPDTKAVYHILNLYAEDLRKKVHFANTIAEGNYDAEYSPLGNQDVLGNALLNLGNSLKKAENARKEFEKEEKKRRWTSEALARLAEVIRLSSTDVNTLSDQVVRFIVREVGASQGALFLSDTEPTLRLVSAFACNRKKHISRSFRPGEGLVGTCALEKNSIYLTDIPANYIKVTSGLGESKPGCLMLIPLIIDNQVLGVLEVASLKEPEPHYREFLEKSAESIASAVSMVQINTRNRILLEKSQQQAHELAEQDRKMRQNIEMLQIAQEEATRREREIAGILKAINLSSLVLELDTDSRILSVNERFCQLIGTKPQLVTGKRYATLMNLDITSDSYQQLWNDLNNGKPRHSVESIRLAGGREVWLSMNFTPLTDQNQQVNRILCIASDITESKQQEMILQEKTRELLRKNLELETLYQAVDQSLIRSILQPDATISDANENYLRATGYTRKEVIGKNYRTFLKSDELDQFTKIWNELMKEKAYSGVLKRTRPTGEEIWLMSGFTPLKDENGRIYKVYFLAQDITEKRLKYKLLEEANKEIERLRNLLWKETGR